MLTLLLAALLLGAPLAPGSEDLPPNPWLDVRVPAPLAEGHARWLADLDQATLEARLRHCPLLVVLTDDESEGFQTMWKQVFQLPEFQEFSENCVLLIAFSGTHHLSQKRMVDGYETEWCSLFDVPCDEHRRSHRHALATYVSEAFWNPLQVYCQPDGTEIARLQGHQLHLAQMVDQLAEAQKAVGDRPMTLEDYRETLEKIKVAIDERGKKGHGSCLRTLESMIKRELKSPEFQGYVQKLITHLVDEGSDMLFAAEELQREGLTLEARKVLTGVVRNFRGYPPAEEAQKRLKEL